MRPRRHIAMAGLPCALGAPFVTKFARISPVASWLPIDRGTPYTTDYATALYQRLVGKLKRFTPHDRENLLSNTNVVLLYVDKNDGSHSALFRQFEVEALVVPLTIDGFRQLPVASENQRRRAVNDLVAAGRRALKRAGDLLSAIGEEVNNRRNRTCLLLPPVNFGAQMNKVFDYVRDASVNGLGPDEFRNGMKRIERDIPKSRQGGRTYFKGQGALVFRSPAKGAGQHGLAPTWDDTDHNASCVLRGRLRFGASYDPRFHYDCDTPHGIQHRLQNCHGCAPIRRRSSHVNIAPNDNVR